MNSIVKKKWIEALRNGEYIQNRGCLRRNDLFCCLGVLCDLHSRETNTGWSYPNELGVYSYIKNNASLDEKVMEWSGLNSH